MPRAHRRPSARVRSPFVAFLVVAGVVACRDAPPEPPRGPACPAVPECNPPTVGETWITATPNYCSADGTAVVHCADVDKDGCLEAYLTLCGGEKGCEEPEPTRAQCKSMFDADGMLIPLNAYGYVEPGKAPVDGFVGDVIPVDVAKRRVTMAYRGFGVFWGAPTITMKLTDVRGVVVQKTLERVALQRGSDGLWYATAELDVAPILTGATPSELSYEFTTVDAIGSSGTLTGKVRVALR